jgi:hypothetical protein
MYPHFFLLQLVTAKLAGGGRSMEDCIISVSAFLNALFHTLFVIIECRGPILPNLSNPDNVRPISKVLSPAANWKGITHCCLLVSNLPRTTNLRASQILLKRVVQIPIGPPLENTKFKDATHMVHTYVHLHFVILDR